MGPAVLQWVSVHGISPCGWYVNEPLFQIDDRGVPPFLETPDLEMYFGIIDVWDFWILLEMIFG